VAHSLSAQKRVRQNEKRRARNRARKEEIKSQIKGFDGALLKGDVAAAETALRTTVSVLDKVASKNTIHKKAASRKRSRLTKQLNVLRAGGKPQLAGVGTRA